LGLLGWQRRPVKVTKPCPVVLEKGLYPLAESHLRLTTLCSASFLCKLRQRSKIVSQPPIIANEVPWTEIIQDRHTKIAAVVIFAWKDYGWLCI
jgi:hypothetical protein